MSTSVEEPVAKAYISALNYTSLLSAVGTIYCLYADLAAFKSGTVLFRPLSTRCTHCTTKVVDTTHLLWVVVDLDLVREVGRLALGSLQCRKQHKRKRKPGERQTERTDRPKDKASQGSRAGDEAKRAKTKHRIKNVTFRADGKHNKTIECPTLWVLGL